MQESILRHLVCPQNQGPLHVEAVRRDGDRLIEGVLRSAEGIAYQIRCGIPEFVTDEAPQSQTVQSFRQKWGKHNYYREHTRRFYTEWYLQRYGFVDAAGLRKFLVDKTFVLDAGTGSGRDAVNFAEHSSATVFGVDTAREALEVARKEVAHSRVAFVRADVTRLPFPDDFFDFINCDQVIHHTPDPRETFEHLRTKLRKGGTICTYVYRKKAAIREYVDDYVRERIRDLPVDKALSVCEGFTRLGKTLADLKATVDIEEDIPVLGIRRGRYDLQRFIHWNVMKCFWNDEFDFFTNNIVNFDWYHPEFCYRFEPEAFRSWFDTGWDVQAWDVQDAGISCRAVKV